MSVKKEEELEMEMLLDEILLETIPRHLPSERSSCQDSGSPSPTAVFPSGGGGAWMGEPWLLDRLQSMNVSDDTTAPRWPYVETPMDLPYVSPLSPGYGNAAFQHSVLSSSSHQNAMRDFSGLNSDRDFIRDTGTLDSWKPSCSNELYADIMGCNPSIRSSSCDEAALDSKFIFPSESSTKGKQLCHSPDSCGDDLGHDLDVFGSQFSFPKLYPKLQHGFHGLNGNDSEINAWWLSQLQHFRRTERNAADSDLENSLIIEAKRLFGYFPKTVKNSRLNHRLESFPVHPLMYERSMAMEEGFIYYLAKDQQGCRLLQSKLEEGKNQVDVIFSGLIYYVAELMVNPFGNYLVQKLLEVCTEGQITKIVRLLTARPNELLRISLNAHGTRSVQKLIKTLKTRKQIAPVISALKPGFILLMKDHNGNHVIRCCLMSLGMEDNKLIFDAAAKRCVDIATHRYGCFVLQQCIEHSTGESRRLLIAEVSANGILLSQDPYGNYAVQCILNLRLPSALSALASKFEGSYILLSTQKFGSNVVEKCLHVFGEERRAKIIEELLLFPNFEQLLQDPFANYVIQCALLNSNGHLRTSLIKAISPHAAALRTVPYSKRIFSRALIKKRMSL